MAEALEEITERLASAITQKCLNIFEEKFEKIFDKLFQDWTIKIELLERKIIDSTPERVQTEIKKQEVLEISASEKGLALEAKSENNSSQHVVEKIQMEKGAEVPLIILRSDLVWQIGKFYNINFWIFGQNQLPRDIAVLFGVKTRSGVLQNEKAGGLFLPEVRGRKEGEIVKKGMG